MRRVCTAHRFLCRRWDGVRCTPYGFYEAALILAHAENPRKDAAGFHLQQSVEKSSKAWLALRGIDYPRTHDLNVLLGLLEDQDEEIGPYWPLLELNPFAVQP